MRCWDVWGPMSAILHVTKWQRVVSCGPVTNEERCGTSATGEKAESTGNSTDSSKFSTLRRNSITHGYSFKLFLSHSRVDVRKYFFVSVLSGNGIIYLHVMIIFAVGPITTLSDFYLQSKFISR